MCFKETICHAALPATAVILSTTSAVHAAPQATSTPSAMRLQSCMMVSHHPCVHAPLLQMPLCILLEPPPDPVKLRLQLLPLRPTQPLRLLRAALSNVQQGAGLARTAQVAGGVAEVRL